MELDPLYKTSSVIRAPYHHVLVYIRFYSKYIIHLLGIMSAIDSARQAKLHSWDSAKFRPQQ